MPYIKSLDRRKGLKEANGKPDNMGELNYLLTTRCIEYIDQHGKKYAVYNHLIGCLEVLKAVVVTENGIPKGTIDSVFFTLVLSIITEFVNTHRGEPICTRIDVAGCISCVILELYRRKVAPYEDTKIKENGDVY